MHNNSSTYNPLDIANALHEALGSAYDNLPDVVGDPTFGPEATMQCCADIAALQHLLAPDANGQANILAYL
jgi:hypothetical protein